jgi:hypothetical protein
LSTEKQLEVAMTERAHGGPQGATYRRGRLRTSGRAIRN